MIQNAFLLCTISLLTLQMTRAGASDVLIEAESFKEKGGWVVDQQFMDLMGSSYLMAHGMGKPVGEAKTRVTFSETGVYHVYVRTYNWTSPWHKGEGPGKFTVTVNDAPLRTVLGAEGTGWMWQKAGSVTIDKKETAVSLRDLTGFNGRCDALYFTREENAGLPNEGEALERFRAEKGGVKHTKEAGSFDFVVSGGGVAGMCAAVSAARLGMKVALINDRPVLGGNNSSEVRVHLGGRIELPPYPQLGNMIKEFGPTRVGNAQPAEYYEDGRKTDWIAREKNITLFPCYRVCAVDKKGKKIEAVKASQIETGESLRFRAPLFADCTGDGTVGYLAGADYVMGREGQKEFNEPTAPEKADKMTMGASVQWYSVDRKEPVEFPEFAYGITLDAQKAEKVLMGEWDWETGMNLDQLKDFECIRDYGLMIVYSNWSYLKNKASLDAVKNRDLGWVAYISGKRESRRLLGDHILTENDIRNYVEYPDATASTSWSIDLHYPHPENSEQFSYSAFKSIAKHISIYPYPIPYRCFYSRNVDNLFMAGRNISVTHVALGTVRVMRTTGMMGEVVGMAASLCARNGISPRGVYESHLPDLKALMEKGVGQQGLPNNQKYNMGATLTRKPASSSAQ